MRPGLPRWALTFFALLPVLGTFGAVPAAAQLDLATPNLFNRQSTDCLGTLTNDTSLTTGTPNIQIAIQDVGSGIRFGRSPHTGGTVARSGTKLLLHFDGVLTDTSTFSNNGTAIGGPFFCTAPNGFSGLVGDDCIDLNGTSQAVSINASASLNDTTSQITMQAWINPTQNTAGDPIIEFNDGSTIGVHLWHSQDNSGNVYANLVGTSGASNIIKSSSGFIKQNQWQLITLTFGGSVAELYYNDVMVASQNLVGLEPLDVGRDLYIGRRASTADWYSGKIDEVRILRSGLTAQDIAADFFSGTLKLSTSGFNGEFVNQPISYAGGSTNGIVTVVTATVNSIPFAVGGQNIISWSYQDMTGNTAFTSISMNISEVAPSFPGALTGTPSGTTGINWGWQTPSQICLSAGGGPAIYQVVDENTTVVSGADVPNTDLAFAESGLSVNTNYRRRARAVDAFGNGALTSETTAYTEAAVPTSLAFSNVSTGSFVLSWNAASNPNYTRYEVGFSSDNFTTVFSTPVIIADNFKSVTIGIPGLESNTTYNVRVRARNGRAEDTFGQKLSAYATGSVATLATGPTSLAVTILGTSSVTWTWSAVPTATSYRLEDSDTNNAIVTTAGTSFTQTGLTPNLRTNAKLRADNASGTGQFGPIVSAVTNVNPPTGNTLVAVTSATVTVSWSGNGNPAGTLYQAIISTSASFTVVTQTISVNGLSGSFLSLLPASNYAIKVRGQSNGGALTTFSNTVVTQTTQFVGISSQATPSSPYNPVSGGVAVYHFDESSGTAASDSSGQANHATLTCNFVNCSTPTFTSGMSGLGNAVEFSGIQDTWCNVPSVTALETTDDITVSAWVNPSSLNQIAGAGIVVKGSGTFETYALEITALREWQFRIVDSVGAAHTIKSTMTIAVDKWTHLTGVFDAKANSDMLLYVDGVQTSSNSFAGVTARRIVSHDLTIGNRQNLSGAYNRGFRGLIDEVQVQNEVRSAAQVLVAYNGSFTSEFTPPAPNSDKRLKIPPNTFGQEAVILISGTPQTSPIIINGQILTDGLASPPTGQTFVPNSLIEVVANLNGSAFTGTLNSSVTVSIPYPDTDNNQIVDGTDPGLPVSGIVMYTLNESVVRWEPLSTTVDLVNKRVNGLTNHFSIFALFAPTAIQPDVNSVRVYPNPWKPNSGSRFDSVTYNGTTGIAFDNLSTTGSIRIFTLSGELVVSVPYSSNNNGTAIWDGRNSGGQTVASGVYFAYVKSNTGDIAIKKFAIQR